MSVTPTAGIAAAWSAAKVTPSEQPDRPVREDRPEADPAPAAEAKKGPPPGEGRGTRVDIRV